MIVLGLHGGFTINQHESSACLIIDGNVVALCEEERYTRLKCSYGQLPHYSINACLEIANISFKDIDLIVTPGITYNDFKERFYLYLKHLYGNVPKIESIHHQEAHIASSFYSSPYDKALCISLDATGDGNSGFVGIGDKTQGIKIIEKIPTQNSIGLFYTLMTYYLGFTDGDEYKVMGLAPYGTPNIDLSKIIATTEYGWNLNWNYFRHAPPCKSPFEPPYSNDLSNLLHSKNRLPNEKINTFHKDIAASTQHHLEKCLTNLLLYWKNKYPDVDNLCLSGGVALNCAANGVIANKNIFKSIFVPPVASDRGLSLGCAYSGYTMFKKTPNHLTSAYLGSSYDNSKIKEELDSNNIKYKILDNPCETASNLLCENKIIGWYQGKSEAGARALGNRSILASAANPKMKEIVNSKIKFRESFRPFAPAVLFEDTTSYFQAAVIHSPWMCFTAKAHNNKMNEIPAVLHVDGTARYQTVTKEDNNAFYNLISSYKKKTGISVILNTSFNLKGQPIIETPRDAIMTFFGCGLDALIIDNYIITK